MNEWNIQSRGHACQSCSKAFADHEAYHTILLDEKKDFHRIDVCSRCWVEQFDGARDRQGFVSHWQGEYQAPPPPTETIKRATVEDLLRKIIERNDPQYAVASYILAAELERKRILKVKEQIRTEGKRIFVYEQPKTGDVFTIPDPDLQLNQLEAVQRDVAALIEHGLPGDTSQESTPPPVTAESGAPAPGVTAAEDPVPAP